MPFFAVAGIDPGITGGVAVRIERDGVVELRVSSIPVVIYKKVKGRNRQELDLGRFVDLMSALHDELGLALVVVEQPCVIPRNSRSSIASLFRQFGEVRGVLAGMHLPVETPPPQVWKADILKGTSRDKAAAIAHVRTRYPTVDIRDPGDPSKYLDGLADAVCLAEYGRRRIPSGGA